MKKIQKKKKIKNLKNISIKNKKLNHQNYKSRVQNNNIQSILIHLTKKQKIKN